MNKAYKIKTNFDENKDSWSIYSAENAGKAKTSILYSIKDGIYSGANYSSIYFCRRAEEYDGLASKYLGCIAWKQGNENWQQDKGHWYDE